MAQTGVPFGEVSPGAGLARHRGPGGSARRTSIPKRPIEGFACERSEVSGTRRLGRHRRSTGEAPRALLRFPLHRELLPSSLHGGQRSEPDAGQTASADEREPLFEACDQTPAAPGEGSSSRSGSSESAASPWDARRRPSLGDTGVQMAADPPPEPRQPEGQPGLGARGPPGAHRPGPVRQATAEAPLTRGPTPAPRRTATGWSWAGPALPCARPQPLGARPDRTSPRFTPRRIPCAARLSSSSLPSCWLAGTPWLRRHPRIQGDLRVRRRRHRSDRCLHRFEQNVDKSASGWKTNLNKPPKLKFADGETLFWMLDTNVGTHQDQADARASRTDARLEHPLPHPPRLLRRRRRSTA